MIDFYWNEFCEKPELKKRLLTKEVEPGIYQIYDPAHDDRIVLSGTAQVLELLEDD